MQFSKLARKMLKYLPVLSVLVAIALGLWIGKGLYPTSDGSQSKKPMIVLTANSQCDSSTLYLSLPPKCKTLDGKFVPAPGIFSEKFLFPDGK